ncbi:MAG: hypothetical protein D6692_06585 [Planctomycetota bacterium]|nr:MAG: hypothetical protein D6692_06585 [Planctomycetota bacterium]
MKLFFLKPAFGVKNVEFVYFDDSYTGAEIWNNDTGGLRPPYLQITRIYIGWPFCSTFVDRPAVSHTPDEQLLEEFWPIYSAAAGLRQGVKAPDWWPKAEGVYRLPVTPLWGGLVTNSMIFAAFYFLPGTLFRIARQRHRRKRNACLNCGYDFGTLSPCPECGSTP